MPDVSLTSNDSDSPGYLAVPATLPAPGVIVLKDWWGLDGHVSSVCDRLAAEGFVAAPPTFTGESQQPNPPPPSSG